MTPPPFGPGQSPRRDRGGGRDAKRPKTGDRAPGGKTGDGRRDGRDKPLPDLKAKLHQRFQSHPEWTAVWLEGIDPPTRTVSNSNVTALLVANGVSGGGVGSSNHTKFGGGRDGGGDAAGGAAGDKMAAGAKGADGPFGFTLTVSRLVSKKSDRERECIQETLISFEHLRTEDGQHWCRIPDAGASLPSAEAEAKGLERLQDMVRRRFPKVSLELPEPSSLVVLAAQLWGAGDGTQAAPGPAGPASLEPELLALDRFEPGFAELLREARRVNGLVRKLWFLAMVMAKPDSGSDAQAFALGVGFATDRQVARTRALYAAEQRVPALSQAVFSKSAAQKVGTENSNKDDRSVKAGGK